MTLFQNWRRSGRNDPEALMVAPFDWLRTMLGDSDPAGALIEGRWMPRADLSETERDFVLAIELPGFDIHDVEVRYEDHQLVVRGERKQKTEERERRFLRVETSRGAFERRFGLPPDAATETDGVEARFQNGVLEVRIPKREPKRAAKVPIRSM